MVKPRPGSAVREAFIMGAAGCGEPAVCGQGDLVAVGAQDEQGALDHLQRVGQFQVVPSIEFPEPFGTG